MSSPLFLKKLAFLLLKRGLALSGLFVSTAFTIALKPIPAESFSAELPPPPSPSTTDSRAIAEAKRASSLKLASPEGFSEDLGLFKRDSSYYIQKMTAHWNLIFSEELKSLSPSFLDSSLAIDKAFSSLFKRQSDFRTGSILFSSPRYQIANALASFDVTAFVQIYPSNTPDFIDLRSFFDWSKDTLIHEINHIYQMSQNSYWENYFWQILGFIYPDPKNSILISSFTHRNKYLPLWILEGDSVLTESIYGSGGRLWSGHSRAFVLSQIKENKISLTRLLNFYSDPFAHLEIYLHGGFFFAYLESRYGLKKTKSFFYESSKIFPAGYYGLKWAFQRAFNADIKGLFEDYKEHYSSLAQKQKSAPEKALFRSKAFAPINSDQKSLYFLISDLKSPAELIVWNKKRQKFKKRKARLPVGKVFKRKGKYFSTGNIRTKTNAIEYTLVGENFKPVSKHNSQYVMDFYKNQPLYLDMRKNHQGNPLNFGGEFYDWVHSSALADNEGSVYYFKQEKEKRVLYKNKKPIAEFPAYFSYPVEVSPTEVYFIGPTPYGSSLFVYKKGEGFYRLSESDRIVSARKTKENQFLAAEISPSHYEYKLIYTSNKAPSNQTDFETEKAKKFNQPVFYKDIPQKKSLFEESAPLQGKETQEKQTLSKIKPYRSFPNLIFKSFGLNMFAPLSSFLNFEDPMREKRGFLDEGVFGFLNFEDPLRFNNLLLSSAISESSKLFALSYFYKKYRPQFEISLNYNKGRLNALRDKALIDNLQVLGFLEEEDRYFFEEEKKEEGSQERAEASQREKLFSRVFKKQKPYINYQTRSFSLGLSYPLLKGSEFSLNAGSSFALGQRKFNQNLWTSYFVNKGFLNYQFARVYPYAYSFHKKRDLSAEYSLFFLDTKQAHLSYFLKGVFMENLGREFFLDIKARAFWGLWNRALSSLPLRSSKDFQWSYVFLKESVKNLYQFDMTLFKVFNNNRYRPLKIPVYVNRLAPLGGFSFLSFQSHKELNQIENPYRFALIPFLGAETESALLVEQNIFKLGFLVEAPFFISPKSPFHFQFRVWLKSAM